MNEFINSGLGKILISLLALTASVVFSQLSIMLLRKANNLKSDTNNKEFNTLYDFIKNVVYSCVITTNQIFVDDLKKNNQFTKEKQTEAFNMTYRFVYSIVSSIIPKVLNTSDVDIHRNFLTSLIEETVNIIKPSKENEEISISPSEIPDPAMVEVHDVILDNSSPYYTFNS